MKKKYLILLLVFIFFSGCNNTDLSTKTSAVPEINKNSTDSMKFFSQFTGEKFSKENSILPPYMTIIENSKDARPQSGLSEADIVYETMAEGGIPRFIALFQKNTPKKIGPIRSARPYFLDLAIEYNLPIAHCGASEEAAKRIEKEKLMSLNEFLNGNSYWRDNSRIAPHNLYTSSNKITELVKQKNYLNESPIKLNFDKNFWLNNDLPCCNNINLNLNKYYSTNYVYKDGLYYKYMDHKPSIDKGNDKPITAKNIVIQVTNIKLQQDRQHLTIDLIGEGNGYLISNGKYTKIKWYKKDKNSPTTLKLENQSNIPLNPGNTWWHIIDVNSSIKIN